MEEEKRNLERDKDDLEEALLTAQEELKTICEGMAVEEDKFDKQRLINVLEGRGFDATGLMGCKNDSNFLRKK